MQAYLIVVSAIKKFDWKKVKAAGLKDLRMATAEEVKSITGCVIGAVPPFGSLFPIPAQTMMDVSLQGTWDVCIQIKSNDCFLSLLTDIHHHYLYTQKIKVLQSISIVAYGQIAYRLV